MSLSRRTLFKHKQRNKNLKINIKCRAIECQKNQTIPCYLLLNRLRISFSKKAKQNAAKVVRVAIGVAQLIGNGINEQVASFSVKVDGQTLKNIHVRRVTYRRHRRRQSLRLYRLNSLGANVQDQCVQ